MQQIYRRTSVPKFNFDKVAKQTLALVFIDIALGHWSSPINFLHIFRTTFYQNSYRGLLLKAGIISTKWAQILLFYSQCNENVLKILHAAFPALLVG